MTPAGGEPDPTSEGRRPSDWYFGGHGATLGGTEHAAHDRRSTPSSSFSRRPRLERPPGPRLPDEGDWSSGGYRSGRDRANTAQALFAVGALTTIALAWVRFHGFELLDHAERFLLDADAWQEHESLLESMDSIDTLAWQAAGVALIVWLSRYVDNVPALGGGVPRRSPARTIVYWLVPVINFVFLPIILRDAGRRMAAEHGDHGGLVAAWWLSWIGWIFVLIALILALPDAGGLEGQRQSIWLDIAIEGIFLAQALLSMIMIHRLQADEDHWAGRTRRATIGATSPAAAGTWPGDSGAGIQDSPHRLSSRSSDAAGDGDEVGWRRYRMAVGLVLLICVVGVTAVMILADRVSLTAPAANDTDVPTTSGGRIERPGDGIAITFPVEWTVKVLDEWQPLKDGRPGSGVKLVLQAWHGSIDKEVCTVSDLTRLGASWPRWTALDDAIGWAAAAASEQARQVDGAVAIDLPAGPAAYVDTHASSGRETRETVFHDGPRWLLLRCGGEDPPNDRWRSIAESFEFIPAAT